MNARELQQAIVDDLNNLFSGSYHKTPKHTMDTIKVFRQNLPQFDAQDADDFFPYIIVRLEGGGIATPIDPHKVDVLLVIGVFDDATEEYRPGDTASFVDENGWDKRNLGDMEILEIIEKIQTHYEKKPSLDNGNFYFDGPFNWITQDEDTYPYYFGACELGFTLAAPRKEPSKYV